MTNKEAIEILQEEHDWCQHPSYVNKAIEIAISALRSTFDEEALTLHQLRGMDGKPAYWPEGQCWGLISVQNNGKWGGIPFFKWTVDGVSFENNIEARGMEVYAYHFSPLPNFETSGGTKDA